MFDLFLGLPLHPLVVHGFVVLAPLTAAAVIVYALVPRWRAGLRWPVLVASLVVGVLAVVTRQSGEALRDRLHPLLESGGALPGSESVWLHTQLAGTAAIITGVWSLAAVVLVWFLVKPLRAAPNVRAVHRWTVTEVVSVAILVLAGLTVIVWAVVAGHSGAVATWGAVPGVA